MPNLNWQVADITKQIADLESRLGEVAGELAELQSIMATFLARYRREVLRYHNKLVRVQRQIADLQGLMGDRAALREGRADTALIRLVGCEERSAPPQDGKRLWPGEQASARSAQDNLPPASPALKRLYSEVVARLHPGLAETLEEYQRRRILMAEVDRAYVQRDEHSLRAVAEAARKHGDLPMRVNEQALKQLRKRCFMLEQVIVQLEGQVYELRYGTVACVYAHAQHAQSAGRDLLGEIRDELRGELQQARRKLAALQNQMAGRANDRPT